MKSHKLLKYEGLFQIINQGNWQMEYGSKPENVCLVKMWKKRCGNHRRFERNESYMDRLANL